MTTKEIEKFVGCSACGKYVYPIDSVTGARTFAPVDYFLKNLETKYGNDLSRFVREYKTRETKKYLKEGYTPAQIKEIASKHKGFKLPKINVKLAKDPRVPRKPRKKRLQSQAEEQKVTDSNGVETIIKIYPWSHDPQNYFKDDAAPISIAEQTKDACLRPDIYLDAECEGCPYYTECTCKLKHPLRK